MSERLNWGLIGGGEGSQIGFAHRIGAELDGKFKFAAGALDLDCLLYTSPSPRDQLQSRMPSSA